MCVCVWRDVAKCMRKSKPNEQKLGKTTLLSGQVKSLQVSLTYTNVCVRGYDVCVYVGVSECVNNCLSVCLASNTQVAKSVSLSVYFVHLHALFISYFLLFYTCNQLTLYFYSYFFLYFYLNYLPLADLFHLPRIWIDWCCADWGERFDPCKR